MQEGDIVKIDLLVEHSGSRKSKEAWNRIKKDFEELAQQTHNSQSMPCHRCGKAVDVDDCGFVLCDSCSDAW